MKTRVFGIHDFSEILENQKATSPLQKNMLYDLVFLFFQHPSPNTLAFPFSLASQVAMLHVLAFRGLQSSI